MDKRDFFHKLKGLRACKRAGKNLYPAGIETGQKIAVFALPRFRTFDPVDMHGFIHMQAFFEQQSVDVQCRWQCADQVDVGLRSGLAALPESKKNFRRLQRGRRRCAGRPEWFAGAGFFFRHNAAHPPVPQVYKQKLVYRIVVVVNGTPHLWISRILSTTSSVYVAVNPVGYRCVCLREKMDKNPGKTKSGRSPQSVPVDMQMLIHRPADGP